MKKPTILRKRLIPFETVDISNDELMFRDETLIITRWKAIHPRSDISGGVSFAFLNEGIKISKFYDKNDNFIYWYCDVIEIEYEAQSDKFTFVDLLLDVKVMPDGAVLILDADELAEAIEKGLISQLQTCSSLRKLDKLLKTIYKGEFPPHVCTMDEYKYSAAEPHGL